MNGRTLGMITVVATVIGIVSLVLVWYYSQDGVWYYLLPVAFTIIFAFIGAACGTYMSSRNWFKNSKLKIGFDKIDLTDRIPETGFGVGLRNIGNHTATDIVVIIRIQDIDIITLIVDDLGNSLTRKKMHFSDDPPLNVKIKYGSLAPGIDDEYVAFLRILENDNCGVYFGDVEHEQTGRLYRLILSEERYKGQVEVRTGTEGPIKKDFTLTKIKDDEELQENDMSIIVTETGARYKLSKLGET